ncbi:ABC transporter ATP-binding protein [uncultured Alsobacter sp.]|uniref:ABC transporter ATP-binding protein n=1 Tax=uncultured Alsobacter sp. TaxID=1748258 RepID=UPI0025F68C78|nr:ABC transporter ATP-binding protein [uncultured Alsobacter sp.]
MLTVEGLHAGYGELPVLRDVSFSVAAGRIVGVLGANGAGKTTLMAALSGLIAPTAGRVMLDGKPVQGLPAETIVGLGMSHVPQGRRIFPGLTVRENLMVARTKATSRAPGGFPAVLDTIHDLFPRLAERKDQLGWSLSGGEQQMLAVARALVARPKVILLDEPSLGIAPLLVEAMFDAIQEIRRREGITVLVVEQNAEQALRISDEVHIMELGRIVASGDPVAIGSDPEIVRAYLGT